MRAFTIAVALMLAIVVVGVSATNYKIVITQEAAFTTIIAQTICGTDQSLVLNYKLSKGLANPIAYVTSKDANLDGSACGTALKAKQGTALPAVQTITALADTDVCGLKCGGPDCLCEIGMACTASGTANPCEAIAECTDSKCVARQAQLSQISYSFPPLNGLSETDQTRFQNDLRDAISQFGIDSHCWDQPYVYNVPAKISSTTQFVMSILGNDITKRGCAGNQFVFPASLVPKTTAAGFSADKVSVKMLTDVKTVSLECMDVTTNKFTCGSTCYAPCLANAACTSDSDCLSKECRTIQDEDGKDLAQKRCSNAVLSSVMMALVLVIGAFLF